MCVLSWEEFKIFLYDKKGLDPCDYYKVGLNYFNKFFFDKELTPISASAFKSFLKNLISVRTNRKISPYTVNNYLKTFKHIVGYLVEKGVIKENFIQDWRLLPTEQPDTDILEGDEMEKLLTIAYGKCYRRAVCLETLLKTGCRPSELFNATWDRLKEDEIFLVNTKSNRSRYAVILKDLMHKIQSLQRYSHNYIFGGEKGKISGRRFREFIQLCLAEARIHKRIRPRELRHSYATMLAMKGVSHFVIKDAMGHTNIATTQLYVHTTKKGLIDAAIKHDLTRIHMTEKEVVIYLRDVVEYLKKRKRAVSYKETNKTITLSLPRLSIDSNCK